MGKMSPTLDTYDFACGHQYSIQSTDRHRAGRKDDITVYYGKPQQSPNICFECYATECQAKAANEAKEKAGRECEEVCAAYKAHHEFLKLQIDSTKKKNNIELCKILEKMSGETLKLWYAKREEYMAKYLVREPNQINLSEIFQKKMDQTQEMIEYMREMSMKADQNKASSTAEQVQELDARRVKLDRLAREYGFLNKTYEESTKKVFEDVTMKLEKLRTQAAELMKTG